MVFLLYAVRSSSLVHDLVLGFTALYVVRSCLCSVPREPGWQLFVLGCVHIHGKMQP